MALLCYWIHNIHKMACSWFISFRIHLIDSAFRGLLNFSIHLPIQQLYRITDEISTRGGGGWRFSRGNNSTGKERKKSVSYSGTLEKICGYLKCNYVSRNSHGGELEISKSGASNVGHGRFGYKRFDAPPSPFLYFFANTKYHLSTFRSIDLCLITFMNLQFNLIKWPVKEFPFQIEVVFHFSYRWSRRLIGEVDDEVRKTRKRAGPLAIYKNAFLVILVTLKYDMNRSHDRRWRYIESWVLKLTFVLTGV